MCDIIQHLQVKNKYTVIDDIIKLLENLQIIDANGIIFYIVFNKSVISASVKPKNSYNIYELFFWFYQEEFVQTLCQVGRAQQIIARSIKDKTPALKCTSHKLTHQAA